MGGQDITAELVTDLQVQHLFSLHLELTKQTMVPGGPEGASVHVGVIDGSFDGAALSGRVAPLVGCGHAVLRGDGFARVEYSLVLLADDHAVIAVDGSGITHYGEHRESRVAFTFHTSAEHLSWLNHVQGVALGVGGREEMNFEVYRLM